MKEKNIKLAKKKKKRLTAVFLAIVAVLFIMTLSRIYPLYRVTGNAMGNTLSEGDVIAARRSVSYSQGDVVVISESGKIMIRRIIALPGQSVKIGKDGTVFVDDEWLKEDYISAKVLGEYDISFPFTVPEGEYFVLCDDRNVYTDSRNTAFGTISADLIRAKAVIRLFPLSGKRFIR